MSARVTIPNIISVDDHVVEPPALWRDRLPAAVQEVGPHVVRERIENPRLPDPEGRADWCDIWIYEAQRIPMLRSYASVGYSPDDVVHALMTYDDMRPG